LKPSPKVLAITALVSLVLGFLIGFIPEHMTNSKLNEQIATLTQGKQDTQGQLGQTQAELTLSNFAVRSAMVYTDAEKNNYSDASAKASSLFTDMRAFSGKTQDQQLKQQIDQVLNGRDATIAALAKADPVVKGRLQEMFLKVQAFIAGATSQVICIPR
jgi:uncharacterized membrane-anchored protein YhcB (DUF1043 family)